MATIRSAPPTDPIKGRGTPVRIAHRYERDEREAVDDGWESPSEGDDGARPPPVTQVSEERVKTVVSTNDSPDIPFDLSINPYRGCEHGCSYCYARPTHSYLNLSPGLDFETRLVAKVNAAERLRAELGRPGYRPSAICIGSATDAYQPVERRLRLTRAVLEVLSACEHPFSIVTKSAGVERDLDLIAPAARRRQAMVFISITTLDAGLSRQLVQIVADLRNRKPGTYGEQVVAVLQDEVGGPLAIHASATKHQGVGGVDHVDTGPRHQSGHAQSIE